MSRISKERMETALEQLKTISEEDYAKVKALAAIVVQVSRGISERHGAISMLLRSTFVSR